MEYSKKIKIWAGILIAVTLVAGGVLIMRGGDTKLLKGTVGAGSAPILTITDEPPRPPLNSDVQVNTEVAVMRIKFAATGTESDIQINRIVLHRQQEATDTDIPNITFTTIPENTPINVRADANGLNTYTFNNVNWTIQQNQPKTVLIKAYVAPRATPSAHFNFYLEPSNDITTTPVSQKSEPILNSGGFRITSTAPPPLPPPPLPPPPPPPPPLPLPTLTVTLNANTPTSAQIAKGLTADIAKFDFAVTSPNGKSMLITNIDLIRGGLAAHADISNISLHDATNNSVLVTNITNDADAPTMYKATLNPPWEIRQGQTKTLLVRAAINANANAGNNFNFQITNAQAAITAKETDTNTAIPEQNKIGNNIRSSTFTISTPTPEQICDATKNGLFANLTRNPTHIEQLNDPFVANINRVSGCTFTLNGLLAEYCVSGARQNTHEWNSTSNTCVQKIIASPELLVALAPDSPTQASAKTMEWFSAAKFNFTANRADSRVNAIQIKAMDMDAATNPIPDFYQSFDVRILKQTGNDSPVQIGTDQVFNDQWQARFDLSAAPGWTIAPNAPQNLIVQTKLRKIIPSARRLKFGIGTITPASGSVTGSFPMLGNEITIQPPAAATPVNPCPAGQLQDPYRSNICYANQEQLCAGIKTFVLDELKARRVIPEQIIINDINEDTGCNFTAADLVDPYTFYTECIESGGAIQDTTCVIGGERIPNLQILRSRKECFQRDQTAFEWNAGMQSCQRKTAATPLQPPTPPPPGRTCEQQGKYTYTGRDKPGVLYGMCIDCPMNTYVQYGGKCQPDQKTATAKKKTTSANAGNKALEQLAAAEAAAAAAFEAQQAQTAAAQQQAALAAAAEAQARASAAAAAAQTRGAATLNGSQRLVRAPERGNAGPGVAVYFGILGAIQGALWVRKKIRK